jgi:uncharacterized protein YndB with AHSA1/START domain
MTETDVRTRDLVVKRTFDAPAEDVWKAWSDPELVMRWWGPRGFTSPTCRMDFRVGGRTIVHMHAPAFGDLYNTWTYRAIEPHRWIEFVQRFSDEGGTGGTPSSSVCRRRQGRARASAPSSRSRSAPAGPK